MDVQVIYYKRNEKPYKSEIHTRNGLQVSVTNAYDSEVDILIDQTQYNALVQANIDAYALARQQSIQASNIIKDDLATKKAAIKVKLMAGTPLTSEEADIVLYGTDAH